MTGTNPNYSRRHDVIVIGAGLNGTNASLELARSGMKVLLIDAGDVIPDAFFDDQSFELFDVRNHLFRLKLLLRGDFGGAFSKALTKKTWQYFLSRAAYPYDTADGVNYD